MTILTISTLDFNIGVSEAGVMVPFNTFQAKKDLPLKAEEFEKEAPSPNLCEASAWETTKHGNLLAAFLKYAETASGPGGKKEPG